MLPLLRLRVGCSSRTDETSKTGKEFLVTKTQLRKALRDNRKELKKLYDAAEEKLDRTGLEKDDDEAETICDALILLDKAIKKLS